MLLQRIRQKYRITAVWMSALGCLNESPITQVCFSRDNKFAGAVGCQNVCFEKHFVRWV